jgi:hypothetical protein
MPPPPVSLTQSPNTSPLTEGQSNSNQDSIVPDFMGLAMQSLELAMTEQVGRPTRILSRPRNRLRYEMLSTWSEWVCASAVDSVSGSTSYCSAQVT